MPISDPPNEAPNETQLVAALRATSTGVLLSEEAAWKLHVCIHGPSGRLIGDVPHDAIDVEDLALAAGSEDDEHPQLHVSVTPIDPNRDAAADRFVARFGEPVSARLCHAEIHAAKWLGEVFDASVIDLTNPLSPRESAVLRSLNSDRDALARAIERQRGHRPPDITAVGIDPDGLDLRLGHRIVRIEAEIGDDPDTWLRRWLKGELGERSR